MGLWKRFKKAIARFIDNLAKENEKAFGNTRPDCCQLNRNEQTRK